jgi:YggT family protein
VLLVGQSVVGIALCAVGRIYLFILIARILLSWVPSPPEPLLPVVRFVSALTDPLLRPLRGVIPPLRIGAVSLDMTVLIVYFGISFLLLPLLCRL